MKRVLSRLFFLVVAAMPGAVRADSAALPVDSWTAAAPLLESLEESFSSIRSVQTRFTQEKQMRIFDRPVVIQGRLSLENPGRLAWRVDRPIRYALVIRDGEALQWDEETRRVQRLPFSGNPVFETVITQIEQWFSGQFLSLAGDYQLEVESDSPPRLAFVPKAEGMAAKAIRRVTVSVREDCRYVEQIVIEDVSGDRTSLVFHDTVLNEPVDSSAWEVVPREP